MTVYSYKRRKLPLKRGAVVALGFFDGMHVAHRALLRLAGERARIDGVPFGVFTFNTDSAIKKEESRIYSDKIRQDLITGEGADFTVTVDFSEISDMTAENFVRDVLIEDVGVGVAVSGFNFRFGKGASGDASELKRLMREYGADTLICDRYEMNGVTVSSTEIRARLCDGKIEEANALLGSPYRMQGEVQHGRGVGRALGFPTVNTVIPPSLVSLKNGVYRTAVVIDESIYTAITNVGICPTYEKREKHAETYIIDYKGDLYGSTLNIYFLNYLREEIRFSSENELIMQINIDKTKTLEIFGDVKWQEFGLN